MVTIKYTLIYILLLFSFLLTKQYIKSNVKPKQYTKTIKAFCIGDSGTPLISTENVKPISNLWKVGWNLNQLTNNLKYYPTDTTITHIFISIGTNGFFNLNDNVKLFDSILVKTFPKSQKYIICGTWGWGYNKCSEKEGIIKTEKYYNKFSKYNYSFLNQGKGYMINHPDYNSFWARNARFEINNMLNL
jgi:hypothetical protein